MSVTSRCRNRHKGTDSAVKPDVLPTADYGFQAGVRDVFGLSELPKAKALEELAEPWRPHRTAASWYFWQSRGFVPQSGAKRPGTA